MNLLDQQEKRRKQLLETIQNIEEQNVCLGFFYFLLENNWLKKNDKDCEQMKSTFSEHQKEQFVLVDAVSITHGSQASRHVRNFRAKFGSSHCHSWGSALSAVFIVVAFYDNQF